ncbi:MAG: bifunctional diaminohydroxyphosphoribosylaminopyrimidine deaminase/5-amino-6-(5-phosphoribosylamino)uracil reductase RibD [Nitrospinae bacterium]|nr:bifunctional diaminohydroxyphosphoribosylaminopyrimidine deaminase/5-amino-6-(5-phosphoribosylamino)uracil reductase RibD [Nitrospinota bacterium]
MSRAIQLALKGKGRTSPNPAVGAVIARNGKIIGEGWHKKAGKPHAEIEALNSLATSAKGSTLYVTLEPCNHHGLTPPCARAIVDAGIKEVVIGASDPSPKKGLKGAAWLKRHGVSVVEGVMREECERLIEDFAKHSVTGRPLVLLKSAITLDGKISTQSNDSKWISCEKSRKVGHRLRNEYDAVMVGSDTVIYDDPQLTVRFGSPKRNPLRVVVDGKLRIPLDCNIVRTAAKIPTIVVTTNKADPEKIETLTRMGVDVITATERKSHVDLNWLMEELGRRNVMSVLLEGGGRFAGAAFDDGIVDRVIFFIAMKITGGDKCAISGEGVARMADAWAVEDVRVDIIGDDLVVEGRVAR